jgi:hypothetical protein
MNKEPIFPPKYTEGRIGTFIERVLGVIVLVYFGIIVFWAMMPDHVVFDIRVIILAIGVGVWLLIRWARRLK